MALEGKTFLATEATEKIKDGLTGWAGYSG
jgi:hypothetical protein